MHRQATLQNQQHETYASGRRADNLTIGNGKFYGQSEAKSYGNFGITSTERVTRVRLVMELI